MTTSKGVSIALIVMTAVLVFFGLLQSYGPGTTWHRGEQKQILFESHVQNLFSPDAAPGPFEEQETFEGFHSAKVKYDFFKDIKANPNPQNFLVKTNQVTKISFEKNDLPSVPLVFKTSQIQFPEAFTLIVQGRLGPNNGDLWGTEHCGENRFMVHSLLNSSLHFFMGEVHRHTVAVPIDPKQNEKEFSLIISKKKGGAVDLVWGHILTQLEAGAPYSSSFSTSLLIGSSDCGDSFSGDLYRFVIYESALSHADLGLVARLLHSEKSRQCSDKNFQQCLLALRGSQ